MATLKAVDKKFRSIVTDAVVTGTSGYLACRRCVSYWCAHVEKAMKEGLDAHFVFADLREVGDYHLGVPIVPSRNIYAEVWAEKWRSDSLKTWLISPQDATQNQMFGDHGIFLGFLNEGEGRNVLRQMILAEFASDFVEIEPQGKCKSPSHNVFTQKAIELACNNDAGARVANGWCMRFYNKCVSCFAAEGASNDFDPDLVPEM